MPFTTILSIVSTSAIVAGVIFAAVQLRHLNRQRARDSALQMVHSFQTPEFLYAVDLVFNLPEGLSKRELEERLGEKMISALMLIGTLESIGILVYRREMDIQMVEDFFSGIIILSGRKFRNYLSEMRAIGKRETYYEWFQWLYEQFEKRESRAPVIPAYEAFRNWKS